MKLLYNRLFNLFIIVIITIIVSGCQGNDTATVEINLGLPSKKQAVYQKSLIDKILCFFSTEAIAQEAPAGIVSVTVEVSGPEMMSMYAAYPADGKIIIIVPSGKAREFTITAYNNPLDDTAILSYQGKTIVDLEPGENKKLSLSMKLHGTKILIPDINNNRVVQVTSLQGGSALTTLTWKESFFETDAFSPCDIDFDSLGRIYILHTRGSTQYYLRRADSIDSSFDDTFTPDISGDYKYIAVDRENDLVYLASDNNLACYDYNGIFLQDNFNGISAGGAIDGISGMYFDEQGMLYIVHKSNGIGITKYNPYAEKGEDIVTSYTGLSQFSSIKMDVMVKSGYIYVTNYNGTSGYLVMKFDSDLTLLDYDGSTSIIPGVWEFYGPFSFAAGLGDNIYICDFIHNDNLVNDIDKIIGFDDIGGSVWQTYGGPTGVGIGDFDFYNSNLLFPVPPPID